MPKSRLYIAAAQAGDSSTAAGTTQVYCNPA